MKSTPKIVTILALAAIALLPAALQAQATQNQVPELKQNPILALRNFEPPIGQDYQLGRGDQISIAFDGRPELNSQQIVGPDGRITLPLAGSLKVSDLTREQAADVIALALRTYYTTLSVTVKVDKYTSNQILLLGAVQHPGVQTFDRPPTLLEVVTRGGAATAGIGDNQNYSGGSGGNNGPYGVSAQLRPPAIGIPDRVAIYRGSDQMIWVELKQLLDSGNAMADLRLKRDDIVYVPAPSERYVSVLGEVQHPGALQLDSNTTLAKLIALSGGLTVTAGRYPNIEIIQPSTGKTRTISFKQVLQPGPLDLKISSGDVIYVPESGFNRVAYTIEKISPMITAITAAALITH